MDLCPACGGGGKRSARGEAAPYLDQACDLCDGKGEVTHEVAAEWRASKATTLVPCPACTSCKDCDGARVVTPTKAVEIEARQRRRKT